MTSDPKTDSETNFTEVQRESLVPVGSVRVVRGFFNKDLNNESIKKYIDSYKKYLQNLAKLEAALDEAIKEDTAITIWNMSSEHCDENEKLAKRKLKEHECNYISKHILLNFYLDFISSDESYTIEGIKFNAFLYIFYHYCMCKLYELDCDMIFFRKYTKYPETFAKSIEQLKKMKNNKILTLIYLNLIEASTFLKSGSSKAIDINDLHYDLQTSIDSCIGDIRRLLK